MNMTKNKIYGIAMASLFSATFSLQSCKPEKPIEDENEVITTMKIVATNIVGQQTIFTFRDLDNTGINLPELFDTIRLSANTSYDVQVLLLDETKNPATNITEEIAEEADAHLFVFEPNPSPLASVSITDQDSRGLPIGLLSKWETGDAGTGTIKITLRHQTGVKDGSPNVGDTDVEVTFQTVIE